MDTSYGRPPSFQHIIELARARHADDPFAFELRSCEYLVRCKGGEYETTQFSWNDQLLEDLDELRQPNCDAAIARRVGNTLRTFLTRAGWNEYESAIIRTVESGGAVSLTIRSAAAELYDLPWELLTIKANGNRTHLGELSRVLLRYAWPGCLTKANAAKPRPKGGRIVLAWSDALGVVPADNHKVAISEACAHGQQVFKPERDIICRVSLAALERTLETARNDDLPISVLHILCHGARQGQTFGLGLYRDDGDGASVIDGSRFGRLLAPHAEQVRLVILSVCDSSNAGEPGNHLGSIAENLHRIGIESVIASRFPLSIVGANCFAATFYDRLIGEMYGLESAFLDARMALTKHAHSLDWASLQLYSRPEDAPRYGETDGDDLRPIVFRPYRGLLPFYQEHTRFFFGRSEECTEVASRLAQLHHAGKPRMVVVAGASGTGKSSLVLGKVIPNLVEHGCPPWGRCWTAISMCPGAQPMVELDRALNDTRRRRRTHSATKTRQLLLVIDQFEELFTHCRDKQQRSLFVRRLWRMCQGEAQADGAISCIITIRVDFLGACDQFVLGDSGLRFDQVVYEDAHRVFLAQMRPEQLREAIEKPAQRVGLHLEPGLSDTIIQEIDGEPGALPLLAHALDEMWQRRSGRTLTRIVYQELGGAVGALESQADAVIEDSLTPAQRVQARRILVRLVRPAESRANDASDNAENISARPDSGQIDSRRRVPVKELRPTNDTGAVDFDAAVDVLVSKRLLVSGEHDGESCLEVAHEELIRRWGKLRTWVDEDRDMLAHLHRIANWVNDWQHQRLARLDLRQLVYAQDIRDQYGDELSEDAHTMIGLSEAAARRSARLQKVGVAIMAGLILVMAMLAALWRYTSEQARHSELRARAATLVAAARHNADTDPTVAFALLREVTYREPVYQLSGWPEAVQQVASSWISTASFSGSSGWAVRFSSDGHSIATSTGTTIRLADGARLPPISKRGLPGRFLTMAFVSGIERIVSTTKEHTVLIWVRGAGKRWRAFLLPGHKDWITSAHFGSDGEQLVTSSRDGTVRVWTRGQGNKWQSALLNAHTGSVNDAAFSSDDKRIVTAGTDRTARIWQQDADGRWMSKSELDHPGGLIRARFNPSGTAIMTVFYQNPAAQHTAWLWTQGPDGYWKSTPMDSNLSREHTPVFSPNGRRIAMVANGRGRIWEWRFDATRTRFGGTWKPYSLSGYVPSMSSFSPTFSPDGDRVLMPSMDNQVRVWLRDFDGSWELSMLSGHKSMIVSAAFSPDGKRIVTSSFDKTVRVWEQNSADFGLSSTFSAPHPTHSIQLTADDDGKQFITTSLRKGARVWRQGTDAAWTSSSLPGDDVLVEAADFSADGTQIVTTSADSTARIWQRSEDGQWSTVTRLLHATPARFAKFGPHRELLVTVSSDHTVHVWRHRNDSWSESNLVGHTGKVQSVAFSGDGRLIVTASLDGTARVWQEIDGSWSNTILSGHEKGVVWADINRDGEFIATRSWDRTARLWRRVGNRSWRFVKALHSTSPTSVSFSPDGERIVITSQLDGRIWSRSSQGIWHESVLFEFGGANTAAFSPDGVSIVSGSRDGLVSVWQPEGDVWRSFSLYGHKSHVSWAKFIDHGNRIVTHAHYDGSRIWYLTRLDWEPRLWRATSYCLTIDERREILGEDRELARQNREICHKCVTYYRDPEAHAPCPLLRLQEN